MADNRATIDPQRLLVLQTLLAFTVGGCLLFSALNIQRGVYPLAAIELLIGMFSAWLLYWIARNRLTQRWIMLYLVLFFGTMMIAISTPDGTPTIFVWVFLIPLISHLLLGRRHGLLISVLFLSLSAAIYFQRAGDDSELMSTIAIANVVLCALVIMALSYAYESAREQTEQRLHRLATTDALTGLPNRSALEPALERKHAEARREGASYALLSMDLDHFKAINDQQGHNAGDRALQVFADLLRQRLRASDLPCRWGGEEFQVLLSGTGREGALHIAETIRAAAAATDVTTDDGITFRVTVSIGVAVYPEDADDPATLLVMADRRLYYAKETGRNRVIDRTPALPEEETRRADG
ncbi:GGDEF domain-containing protein [Aquisalimonas lutea]|uniref:GGDEF domain-containing protein n=1 Tax=Aquisalimonas lutea TaxID=1327750 RepID=UPI0025B3E104|nr:GGDEF domain-containing protein [Aquisalimonas lutea]MDN3518818.1 GGDEF domain-containing protein [Aquisalimonas lutea]